MTSYYPHTFIRFLVCRKSVVFVSCPDVILLAKRGEFTAPHHHLVVSGMCAPMSMTGLHIPCSRHGRKGPSLFNLERGEGPIGVSHVVQIMYFSRRLSSSPLVTPATKCHLDCVLFKSASYTRSRRLAISFSFRVPVCRWTHGVRRPAMYGWWCVRPCA